MVIKKLLEMLAVGCLVNATGCATGSGSGVLTHVPQEPLLYAQAHPVTKTKTSDLTISPAKTQAQFLSQQPIEIQRAFLEYQRTGKARIIQTTDFNQFPYSESDQPVVVCEPLHTCEIELEKGEVITGLQAGDTARWIFNELYSGIGYQRQPHIIAKPKFPDLSTNVVITTTKRTYHIGLLSKSNQYVKHTKFYYPAEMVQQLNLFNERMTETLRQQQEKEVASVPITDPSEQDDRYRISTGGFGFSNPSWKPIRAFNDGTHVFIEMPAQLRVTDAPVFFIKTNDNQKALVNYRVKNNYYIVDILFKQAVMVSGVGSSQEKVLITYVG